MMQRAVAGSLVEDAICRIEALPDAEIANVVRRIPGSHLTTPQKDVLVDGLLGRKRMLRKPFEKILARTNS